MSPDWLKPIRPFYCKNLELIFFGVVHHSEGLSPASTQLHFEIRAFGLLSIFGHSLRSFQKAFFDVDLFRRSLTLRAISRIL